MKTESLITRIRTWRPTTVEQSPRPVAARRMQCMRTETKHDQEKEDLKYKWLEAQLTAKRLKSQKIHRCEQSTHLDIVAASCLWRSSVVGNAHISCKAASSNNV